MIFLHRYFVQLAVICSRGSQKRAGIPLISAIRFASIFRRTTYLRFKHDFTIRFSIPCRLNADLMKGSERRKDEDDDRHQIR